MNEGIIPDVYWLVSSVFRYHHQVLLYPDVADTKASYMGANQASATPQSLHLLEISGKS
jgi:hypothetical protein